MGSLTQERTAPYHVLLLVLAAEGVSSHTRAMLAQLASFERLPVIALTPIPLLDRHPFLISVVIMPFLSRFVFRPQDLGEAFAKQRAWPSHPLELMNSVGLDSDSIDSLTKRFQILIVPPVIESRNHWSTAPRNLAGCPCLLS